MIALIISAMAIYAEKRLIDKLPQTSKVINGFDYSTLISQMAETPLHHIEGIWQFPSTGVKIAICRQELHTRVSNPATVYQMIIVWSPNRAMKPGTVLGLITPSALRGEYDAKIYTHAIGTTMTSPKRFSLKLDTDENSLSFRQHRSKFSINIWRLFDFFGRYAITRNRPELDSDGCIRIYPSPTLPREPIYL